MQKYLDAFDQASTEEKRTLVRGWLKTEPLPFTKELREMRPILEIPGSPKTDTADAVPPYVYLALYDDCIEMMRQPAIFSVRLYIKKMGDYMMAKDQTNSNWRDKSAMQSFINPADRIRLRNIIRNNCVKQLDAAQGRIELVKQYARKVPIRMCDEYFGFPGPTLADGTPDDDTMVRWSYTNHLDAFRNHPFNALSEPEKIYQDAADSRTEMRKWLGEFIPKKAASLRTNPNQTDVVARLLKAQGSSALGWSYENGMLVGLNIGGLLFGAIETTQQVVCQAVDILLKRPDVFEKARSLALVDDPKLYDESTYEFRPDELVKETERPTEFDRYVFEAMRFGPISPFMYRTAEMDYTIARSSGRACQVKKDSIVFALYQSAMFDQSYFPDPDGFRIDRSGADTFHFGYGHHECMGRQVARLKNPLIFSSPM